MRALLAQLEPAPGDLDRNAAAAAEVVRAHPEADLAVFPELFLGGYDLATAAKLAVPAQDAVLAPVREAAAANGTAVILGFAEHLGGGRVANAVACLDADGEWRATYRKTHLFGHEGEVFQPGDELVLAHLAGCRVGVLVCFDMEFPEPARALARAGAKLLVTVAANMEPWGPDHALAARARALDNRLPHVYVNRPGAEGDLRFCGESLAAGPGGDILVRLDRAPGTAVCELEPGARPAGEVDYLHHVRPDLPVAVPSSSRALQEVSR